jgi:hypothetical protein
LGHEPSISWPIKYKRKRGVGFSALLVGGKEKRGEEREHRRGQSSSGGFVE